MAKAAKLPAPETDAAGIKIHIDNEQWILFTRDGWVVTHALQFSYAAYMDVYKMVVERALDWRLKDSNGALIAFDRADLLDRLERIGRLERDEGGAPISFPSIPMQTHPAIRDAFWTAVRESQSLPPLAK